MAEPGSIILQCVVYFILFTLSGGLILVFCATFSSHVYTFVSISFGGKHLLAIGENIFEVGINYQLQLFLLGAGGSC